MGRVATREDALRIRNGLKADGKTVVFTNGCFDILHRGHVEYLTKARELGDVLVVGMNDDASVKRLKGAERPIVPFIDRSVVLAALAVVDVVVPFGEDTPQELIGMLVPDVLVKGADWPIEKVVGKDIVEAAGGSVRTIEFVPDRSTTSIIDRIRRIHPKEGA